MPCDLALLNAGELETWSRPLLMDIEPSCSSWSHTPGACGTSLAP